MLTMTAHLVCPRTTVQLRSARIAITAYYGGGPLFGMWQRVDGKMRYSCSATAGVAEFIHFSKVRYPVLAHTSTCAQAKSETALVAPSFQYNIA